MRTVQLTMLVMLALAAGCSTPIKGRAKSLHDYGVKASAQVKASLDEEWAMIQKAVELKAFVTGSGPSGPSIPAPPDPLDAMIPLVVAPKPGGDATEVPFRWFLSLSPREQEELRTSARPATPDEMRLYIEFRQNAIDRVIKAYEELALLVADPSAQTWEAAITMAKTAIKAFGKLVGYELVATAIAEFGGWIVSVVREQLIAEKIITASKVIRALVEDLSGSFKKDQKVHEGLRRWYVASESAAAKALWDFGIGNPASYFNQFMAPYGVTVSDAEYSAWVKAETEREAAEKKKAAAEVQVKDLNVRIQKAGNDEKALALLELELEVQQRMLRDANQTIKDAGKIERLRKGVGKVIAERAEFRASLMARTVGEYIKLLDSLSKQHRLLETKKELNIETLKSGTNAIAAIAKALELVDGRLTIKKGS